MKMEKRVVVVCSVVCFLALFSAITGFVAETTRLKGDQGQIINPSYPCYYHQTSPAYGLGLMSAFALVIAEVTISVASGCVCCCSRGPRRSHPNWNLAFVCFVISWCGSLLAFLVLTGGAFVSVKYDGQEVMYLGYYGCPAVKPGAYAGAALLSLVSLMLGLVCYVMLNAEQKPVDNTQGGFAMGQAQFPSSVNDQGLVLVQERSSV